MAFYSSSKAAKACADRLEEFHRLAGPAVKPCCWFGPVKHALPTDRANGYYSVKRETHRGLIMPKGNMGYDQSGTLKYSAYRNAISRLFFALLYFSYFSLIRNRRMYVSWFIFSSYYTFPSRYLLPICSFIFTHTTQLENLSNLTHFTCPKWFTQIFVLTQEECYINKLIQKDNTNTSKL